MGMGRRSDCDILSRTTTTTGPRVLWGTEEIGEYLIEYTDSLHGVGSRREGYQPHRDIKGNGSPQLHSLTLGLLH